MTTFFQIVMAVLAGFALSWYYSFVLPQIVAAVIGAAFGLLFFIQVLTSKKISFEMLAMPGLVFLLWPAGAIAASLIARWVFGLDVTPAAATAWALIFVALVVAGVAASIESRFTADTRHFAVLSVAAITLWTVIYTLLSQDPSALPVAAIGVACACVSARQLMILPPAQEITLAGGAVASLIGALVSWAFLAL